MPKYLLLKKYKAFILYSVYAAILSVYAIILSVLYGLIFLSDVKEENTIAITKTLPYVIFGVFFVVLIVVTIRLIKHNYQSIITNESLERKFLQTELELKENELKFLKMQIHPHFLFNTLNTMYGFALKKADETPEMILKLSNLLDYILYQVDKPFVLLKDEINHIKDYLELEKLRFHDTLEVNLNVENIPDNIQVTPMLLIPFVENSFKHGEILNGKLVISITVCMKENVLCFEIVNSAKTKNELTNGIGLVNIKKRLEMLYKDDFSLDIKNTNDQFAVNLSIINQF
jgi:LytS/YehU family sensor histidine kinase